MSESPPPVTTAAKTVLVVLAVAAAGFAAALVLKLVRLPVWLIVLAYVVALVLAIVVYRGSVARVRNLGYESLRDLTVSDAGIRLPAGTMSTRVVPWTEIADVTARRSQRFGDGYVRDAIWLDLITGGGVESSVQCFAPRGKLEPAPPRVRQFEQTAVLDPALFNAVIERLRREIRHRQLHAHTRTAPRHRRRMG